MSDQLDTVNAADLFLDSFPAYNFRRFFPDGTADQLSA